MDKAGIQKLIAACGLPEGVKLCLNGAVAGPGGSALKKALKKDPSALLSGIASLLGAAAAVLGLPPGSVLFVTGFNANNRAPDRFEAALAELRAAVFLSAHGFTGLKLVEQSASRTADISGTRAGLNYIFEVCRLRDNGAPAGAKRLSLKYAKKISQVKVSRKKCGCALGGLVLLDGQLRFGPFVPDPGLLALAGEVLAGKNGAGNEYLCLIRGDGYAVRPCWRG